MGVFLSKNTHQTLTTEALTLCQRSTCARVLMQHTWVTTASDALAPDMAITVLCVE